MTSETRPKEQAKQQLDELSNEIADILLGPDSPVRAILSSTSQYGCRSETAPCGTKRSRRAGCVGCEGVT